MSKQARQIYTASFSNCRKQWTGCWYLLEWPVTASAFQTVNVIPRRHARSLITPWKKLEKYTLIVLLGRSGRAHMVPEKNALPNQKPLQN